MDRIVKFDAWQEAELQRLADDFVALHKGDIMKAFKEMMALNSEIQYKLRGRQLTLG